MSAPSCNQSTPPSDTDEHHPPFKLMFLFSILSVGCRFSLIWYFASFTLFAYVGVLRTIFSGWRIPYTGVVLLIGFLGGSLFSVFHEEDAFLTLTTLSPDFLMAISLPALIFESAYRTEHHAFIKSLWSILPLSVIGYVAVLLGLSLANKYLFAFQQWTYRRCLLLGIILSATKPVTVMQQAGSFSSC